MTESRTVLVTGATGFLGSHCILELLGRGHRVRGTIRDPARAASIRELLGRHADVGALELVTADLTDDAGWDDAVRGCDHVLHVASPLPRETPKRPEDVIVPARDGTLRVLEAAAAAGVRRTVLTSSTAAICYGRGGDIGRPYTEEDWTDPDHPDNSTYTRSKTLAERAAWEFVEHDDSGMELVAINPSAILGPVLERDYGTSAELVLKLLKRDFPACPRLGFPLVDVRDVAWLHAEAMEHPEAAGQRFLCGNEFLWVRDVALVLDQHFPERRVPTGHLPSFLVRLLALFDKTTRSVVFELDKKRPISSAKAKQTFGWQPRSSQEAIVACAESLIAHGVVP